MSDRAITIVNAGLVTSVGLSAQAACAAIRAAITNHSETRFCNKTGEWIVGAQVALLESWRGRAKLVKMLRPAIEECLAPLGTVKARTIPLLLCVAEEQRPGRLDGLDDVLIKELENELAIEFHPELSVTNPNGRVSVALALAHARELIYERSISHVLIAASDSLLVGPTLAALESEGRLLTPENSNGFIPGEGGGALLIAHADGASYLTCEGLGFAQEQAAIGTELPLRADGLTKAIKLALKDAGREMHELDFRITDNSGEQYYFKEADVAVSRILRKRKDEFDIWHPADCIGETGALIGIAALTVALTACRKEYAPGPHVLFHGGNDAGQRAAAIFRYEGGV